MVIPTIDSADSKAHAANIESILRQLAEHTREDIRGVPEPRFQALLETSAEVLTGLRTAFEHYGEGREQDWKL
jgi:hypothetical protein